MLVHKMTLNGALVNTKYSHSIRSVLCGDIDIYECMDLNANSVTGYVAIIAGDGKFQAGPVCGNVQDAYSRFLAMMRDKVGAQNIKQK